MPENAEVLNRHKFQKGKSGNPGGKPKVIKEAIEHAKQNVPKTMGLLFEIACDTSHKTADRISAIKEYHDRALGKAPQSVAHSGNIGLSHEDALLALENLDDGTDEPGEEAS